MFIEQRLAPRRALKVKVLIAPEAVEPVIARTLDISSSGLCVNTMQPMPLADTAQLRFDLLVDGKANPIQVKCKVLYCVLSGSEYKVGFQFLNLNLTAMTTIAKYLR